MYQYYNKIFIEIKRYTNIIISDFLETYKYIFIINIIKYL